MASIDPSWVAPPVRTIGVRQKVAYCELSTDSDRGGWPVAAVGKPSTQRKSPARETGLVSVIGSTWSLGATTLHRGQHTPTKGGGKRIGRSRSPAPAVNHLTGLSRRSGLQQTLENAETQLGMYPLPGRHASKQIVTLRSSCNVVNLSRWSLCRKLSVDDIDDVNLGGTAGTFRAAESLCVRFTLSFRGPSLRVTDPRMMHTVRSVSMPRLAAELEPRLSGRADWKAAVARPHQLERLPAALDELPLLVRVRPIGLASRGGILQFEPADQAVFARPRQHARHDRPADAQ
jgi:hypothetical protein